MLIAASHKMSKGIDYSKWNHLEDSGSSSSSCSKEQESTNWPRVTRLEGPSLHVSTTTPNGTICAVPSSTNPVTQTATVPTAKKKTMNDFIQEWTLRGGTVDTHKTTLYWTQDREAVVLRLLVSSDIKGSHVHVSLAGAVPYEDRHCATMTANNKPTLTIATTTTTNNNNYHILLQGELPYPVYRQEDDTIDWCLETVRDDKKILTLTLYKATPMPNMTLWWNRLMMQFEEISLPDPSSTSNSSRRFQEAWAEAHKQYQQTMQRKPAK